LRGEGERSEDGCVSALEVFKHLQRRVPDSARRLCNANQQPVLRGEESSSIRLTILAAAPPQPTVRNRAPRATPAPTTTPRSGRTAGDPVTGDRFCIACGTRIVPRQRFCTRCGRALA